MTEFNQTGRRWLVNMLKTEVATVTFTKKNGEQRVMQCTLIPKYISQDKYNTELTEDTNLDKSNCTVWDINAQGWRSFLWSNLTYFEISTGDTQ